MTEHTCAHPAERRSSICHSSLFSGHEIIGTVTQVGKSVKDPKIKVGARVGVGAQVDSCGECANCKNESEQYCVGNKEGTKGMVDTYNSTHHDGTPAQGGYSTHIRTQEQFVFAIPDEIESTDAASMLCAGLTVYSPLLRNGVKKGTRVGVVGLGGLGHYAVLWAKAMGADVTVISHSPRKAEDAKKLGASEFISTKEKPDWASEFGREKPLDIIISTASSNAVDIPAFLSSLSVHGRLIFVGMPEDEFKSLRSQQFAGNGALLGGSHIGSKVEALSMLDLAAKEKIKPWVEVLPMKDCGKAIQRLADGDVRYRFVLTQDIEDHKKAAEKA